MHAAWLLHTDLMYTDLGRAVQTAIDGEQPDCSEEESRQASPSADSGRLVKSFKGSTLGGGSYLTDGTEGGSYLTGGMEGSLQFNYHSAP